MLLEIEMKERINFKRQLCSPSRAVRLLFSAFCAITIFSALPKEILANEISAGDIIASENAGLEPYASENPLAPVEARFQSLSLRMGDIGKEVSELPYDSSKTGLIPEVDITYANVDEVGLSDEYDELMLALLSAVQLRKTVFLDSASMDSERVSYVARKLFGEREKPLDSYLLLARWNGFGWEMIYTFDAIVPSLGRAIPIPELSDKALGGSYVMPLVEFAQAAYAGPDYVQSSNDNGDWYIKDYRSSDGNITLYRGYTNGTSRCVIAWRGSIGVDWTQTNFQNLVSSVANGLRTWLAESSPTFDVPNITDLRVGVGYERRYAINLRGNSSIRDRMDQCTHFRLAGHSLGGAMALYTAFVWSYENPNFWYGNLHLINAFNAPAVGNARYLRDFKSRVVAQKETHNFCRKWDPVTESLLGFPSWCTFSGDAYTVIPPWTQNHSANLWRQCTSSRSC